MEAFVKKDLSYEEIGIGVLNESSLHYQIKQWYGQPGDRFEVKVEGNVIDIIRGEHLIEIQTKNFNAIKNKITKLIPNYKITLVYPIALEKWITTTNEEGEVISRRKSPQKSEIIDIFKELVSIPELINNSNLTIDAILIHEEELRCQDGKGSWRRKGTSIVDRNLIKVIATKSISGVNDYLNFLPEDLPQEFTNKILADIMKIKIEKIRRITYCLKKINVIEEVGKKGHELLFKVVNQE